MFFLGAFEREKICFENRIYYSSQRYLLKLKWIGAFFNSSLDLFQWRHILFLSLCLLYMWSQVKTTKYYLLFVQTQRRSKKNVKQYHNFSKPNFKSNIKAVNLGTKLTIIKVWTKHMYFFNMCYFKQWKCICWKLLTWPLIHGLFFFSKQIIPMKRNFLSSLWTNS